MVDRLPTLESLLPEPNSTACLGFYNSAVCHFASFLKTIFIWLHWILVEAYGFSCPVACGILVLPPGIEPLPPALQDGFLTTGPAGKFMLPCILHYQFLLTITLEM